MTEETIACGICGNAETELRPYGKNATWVCMACIQADPEVEAEATRQFYA